ncbi:MAG: iron-sulfur cluster insertion protein ErpA [Gammaproteobacteria bacterium]
MNSVTMETSSPPIHFTQQAAARVKALSAQTRTEGLMLRVYIQGGGCSGFQYGFEFEKDLQDDDTVVENSGVKLVVDPLSLQYLSGASIDYREDLQGSRFVVSNPNASSTCGCGSSFSA